MASQFDRIMEELQQIRRTQAKIHTEIRYIVMWVQEQQKYLDENSLELGLSEPVFEEAAERLADGGLISTAPSEGPRFFERTPEIQSPPQTVKEFETGEGPRLRIPYKAKEGGEAFVEWNSLDEEIQKAIEFARRYDDPWQLYEGQQGEMRISISGQVANELRAWKLGNQIGQ